jgi:hypothetical protein
VSPSVPERRSPSGVEGSRGAIVKSISELDRFNLAREIDQRIETRTKGFLFQTLLDLKEINDKELFKDLGHKSMNDYIVNRLQILKSQASAYVAIIDDVLPYALEAKKVHHGELSEILPSDYQKLTALTKLTQKQRKQLFDKGNVMLRGRQYTLEDFKQLPRKEVIEIISDTRTSKLPKEEKVLIWDEAARNKIADAFDKFEAAMESYISVMPDACKKEFKPLVKPLDTWYNNHLRKG